MVYGEYLHQKPTLSLSLASALPPIKHNKHVDLAITMLCWPPVRVEKVVMVMVLVLA